MLFRSHRRPQRCEQLRLDFGPRDIERLVEVHLVRDRPARHEDHVDVVPVVVPAAAVPRAPQVPVREVGGEVREDVRVGSGARVLPSVAPKVDRKLLRGGLAGAPEAQRLLAPRLSVRNRIQKTIAESRDRKSTRLNSSHEIPSRMPSSA